MFVLLSIVVVLFEVSSQMGVYLQVGELYALVIKAAKVRLFIAIAGKHRLNLFKSDTKQAFLNGDLGSYTCSHLIGGLSMLRTGKRWS